MGKYTDALNAFKKQTQPKSLVPLATPTTLQRRFEGLDLQPTTVPRQQALPIPQITPSIPKLPSIEEQRLQRDIRSTGVSEPEIIASGQNILRQNQEQRIAQDLSQIPGASRATVQIPQYRTDMGARESALTRGVIKSYATSPVFSGKDVDLGLAGRLMEQAIQEGKAEGIKNLGAIEVGGQFLGTAIQYATLGKAVKTIPFVAKLGTGGKFAATQLADLLIDNVVQAPFEVIEAINNDRDAGEDIKAFGKRNVIDALFNLAVGGAGEAVKRSGAIKALGKLFKSNDKVVNQALQEALEKLPANQRASLMQEIQVEPVSLRGITPPQQKPSNIFTQYEPVIESQRTIKQADKAVTDAINSFTEWRKQNFGGAFGKTTAEELNTLKAWYKEDTGIDLDAILKQQQDVQRKAGMIDVAGVEQTIKENLLPQQPQLTPQLPTRSFAESFDRTKPFTMEIELDSPVIREQVEQQVKNYTDNLNQRIPDTSPLKTMAESVDMPSATPSVKTAYDNVIVQAPNLKDVGSHRRWTTDIYRQFREVFGDQYETIKKAILDPFDAAKKARVEDEIALTDALKKDIVDKFNIQRRSPKSAAIQQFGEGRITEEELVNQFGREGANDIIEADKWFRSQYDKLIEEINAPRIAQGKEPIPKLDNYYRHFRELGDNFEGLKNLFESNRQITPGLEGVSEFTRPGEKWASFKQSRTGRGKHTDDAVGGFLDYIKAGTYAKHIDPQIPVFRKLHTDLSNATEGTKNINNFIGFLDEFANDLSGKTNRYDRTLQGDTGRKVFAVINWLNNRMKANAVLGNASSSLAQIANVPQGIAYVKNPTHLAGGLEGLVKSVIGGGDKALYEQSGFLKERLTDSYSQFDVKLLDQPKKLAAWMLGALDEVGSKYIWSSTYRKGIADGVPDPIKYADDITRDMVGGRGIGEVPIMQKSKAMQLIMPFTLEVNNLWKVQGDFLKNKDYAGLLMLYTINYGLNKAMERVRGSGVVFDPIDAIISGMQESEGLGDMAVNVPGRLAGEVVSNVPGGQFAATVWPEYPTTTKIGVPQKVVQIAPSIVSDEGTFKIPGRAELFGKQDPTRYGVGLPLQRAFSSPANFATSILTPWGGGQLKKTIGGGQALGILPDLKPQKTDEMSQYEDFKNFAKENFGLDIQEATQPELEILKRVYNQQAGQTIQDTSKPSTPLLPTLQYRETPSSLTRSGNLRTVIEPTIPSTVQSLAFGQYAVPEVREFFEQELTPYGKVQTENINKLINEGFDAKKLDNALMKIRSSGLKKKTERIKSLIDSGYTQIEAIKIYDRMW